MCIIETQDAPLQGALLADHPQKAPGACPRAGGGGGVGRGKVRGMLGVSGRHPIKRHDLMSPAYKYQARTLGLYLVEELQQLGVGRR